MKIQSLRLTSFRSHDRSELNLAPNVNLLVGPNGAGKTNVLEAAAYLAYGKSFLLASDRHVIQRGAAFSEVQATFERSQGSSLTLRLAMSGEGKKAFLNGSPLDRLGDLVGLAPMVVFSPQDLSLTAGAPADRRRFLDTILSQASAAYRQDLAVYRRALRQRNALLGQVRGGRSLAPGSLAAWDAELARVGGEVLRRRIEFVDQFAGFVERAFSVLDEPIPLPSVAYRSSALADDAPPPEQLARALARTDRRSRDLGRTLVGPHVDDLTVLFGGMETRPYASQGQHRILGLLLRLAETYYLQDRMDEAPILLLDDVFGLLDETRSGLILSALASGELGQSLLTSARAEPFEGIVSFEGDDNGVFHVEHGTVAPLEAV